MASSSRWPWLGCPQGQEKESSRSWFSLRPGGSCGWSSQWTHLSLGGGHGFCGFSSGSLVTGGRDGRTLRLVTLLDGWIHQTLPVSLSPLSSPTSFSSSSLPSLLVPSSLSQCPLHSLSLLVPSSLSQCPLLSLSPCPHFSLSLSLSLQRGMNRWGPRRPENCLCL
jgi:hypothetical protein